MRSELFAPVRPLTRLVQHVHELHPPLAVPFRDRFTAKTTTHASESVSANEVLADPDLATVLAPITAGVCPQGFVG
jgi:hypothetical protein